MAHVPMDDAIVLFRETNPKTWGQFDKVLHAHKGKVDGISDNLIDLMMPMARHFEQSGKAFPNSPQELQDMLNQQLAATGHGGRS